MKTVVSAWWTSSVPDDWEINRTRDATIFKTKDGVEIRLVVLNISRTVTREDLEEYARPFVKDTSQRREIKSHDYKGFLIEVIGGQSRIRSWRAYCMKREYLLITSLDGMFGGFEAVTTMLNEFLERLFLKSTGTVSERR